jgi:hypothetical protein
MDLKHIIAEELNKLITESVSMEHENFKLPKVVLISTGI